MIKAIKEPFSVLSFKGLSDQEKEQDAKFYETLMKIEQYGKQTQSQTSRD